VSSAYLTIAGPIRAEIEVKRSRFLCQLQRIGSEDEARAVIAGVRKEHWKARHHCSALILGSDGEVEHSSDDGEPAGTAGAPMLDVLRGRELSEVLAVVTRWFGGTLLGAGGLARAYSGAVREALHDSEIVQRVRFENVEISVAHSHAGKLESELRSRGFDVVGTRFDATAHLRIAVSADTGRTGTRGELVATVAELTAGTGEVVGVGTSWRDLPVSRF